jgi:membrane-associated protease RseP (regulator of RpoE activity)
MRGVLLLGLALELVVGASPVRADDQPKGSKPSTARHDAVSQHGYLGLAVESLHPALSTQLREVLQNGQGVLVSRIEPESPAAKAGLMPFDILVKFDDQKLYSPEQLIKLVRDSKVGSEVTLTYVRNGKEATAHIKLAEAFMPEGQSGFPVTSWGDRNFQPMRPMQYQLGDGSGWEAFDAIRIAKAGDHRWRAEVDFRSKDGKMEQKKFEGTRDEIRKDIQNEKDLTALERAQLLRSLNLDQRRFDMFFPFEPMGSTTSSYWDRP